MNDYKKITGQDTDAKKKEDINITYWYNDTIQELSKE
jgi:hypothetical protein